MGQEVLALIQPHNKWRWLSHHPWQSMGQSDLLLHQSPLVQSHILGLLLGIHHFRPNKWHHLFHDNPVLSSLFRRFLHHFLPCSDLRIFSPWLLPQKRLLLLPMHYLFADLPWPHQNQQCAIRVLRKKRASLVPELVDVRYFRRLSLDGVIDDK